MLKAQSCSLWHCATCAAGHESQKPRHLSCYALAAPTASVFFCFHITWSAVSTGQTFCFALWLSSTTTPPPTPTCDNMKDLSSCQPNGSDTQTKWNNSEWSWQPGNFRNKLIWQGVFIMLQGTGWSDKNRSWQIDHLLENGTPRWCSEMRGGVWTGSRSWGWLAWWKRGDRALFGTQILSFACFIKHRAGLWLSPAAPVAVRRLCQCTSALTFCNSFCSRSTSSRCLCPSDLSSLCLPALCSVSASLLNVAREGESTGGDLAQIAQLWWLLLYVPYVFIPVKHPDV